MSDEDLLLSDQVLVRGILNGNVAGFAVVVKSTERLVAQIVRKMTTNEDDQKDLVQDIYLKAYQSLPTFRFQSRLSTWIANIAYHTTVNYLKKKKIPVTAIEHAEPWLMATEQPELETIKEESVAILGLAIDQLPPLYKTLITLYHLEQLPNKEIAAITDIPEGTIKSYLYRARKMLKDTIDHHYKISSHDQPFNR
ncbi:MAG TPA: sigma-70 family RNA polymerase sigma factor [Flavobacterium sp.]|nr:sigma-70 family RNA polymerase sigma factor [Flavobacterium sp.]HPJ11516.1 sigma-70 family RNA polymerase sigma factor [Flavobacterium sp.]